jgi:hypothetical protein
MNVHFLDLNKTAVLFFDILNGYYHLADPAAKAKKRPMVENAVRIMKAARSAALPIFFAKGNHRPDNATSVALITDTNISLKPWPGGEVTTAMHVTARRYQFGGHSRTRTKLAGLLYSQIPLERFLPDLSGFGFAGSRHRYDHRVGRLHGRGRCGNGIRRERSRLQHNCRTGRLRHRTRAAGARRVDGLDLSTHVAGPHHGSDSTNDPRCGRQIDDIENEIL